MVYLERWLLNKLSLPEYNEYDLERLRFGVKVITKNLWNALLLYGISIMLGCFFQTLIVHLAFYFLRQVCFGYHFNNSIVCLIMSTIALPIGVKLITLIQLQQTAIFGLYVVLLLIILSLAPVATKKNPLLGLKHKKFLKKKVLIRLGVLSFIFLITPVYIQQLIVYGVLILTLSLIIQKIIGGQYA